MSNVAVVILNYISWADTIKEAEMVHNVCNVSYKDIIIVDNCSPNDSAEKLEEYCNKKCKFISSSENKGYAAGNNLGLRYAYDSGYDYAWIINNDIIISDENVLVDMLEVFDRDSNIACVNPDIYSPSGYLFNRNVLKRNFYYYTIGNFSYKKKGRYLSPEKQYSYIYRPQGCCMVLDLCKTNEIGYMDENTFLYFEEPILAARFETNGYYCACTVNTSVIHNHSKTVKNVIDKKKLINIQNKSFDYYLNKYRGYSFLKRKVCLLFNSLEYYLFN